MAQDLTRSLFKVAFHAKGRFFDADLVKREVDAASRACMSKAGAFIRQRAKTSIRPRKRPSEPGQPPSSHTGLLRRRLFFSYDLQSRSVVIGPEATNQIFFDGDRMPVRGTVPQVLEFGGSINVWEVKQVFPNGGYRWQRADLRSRRRLAGKEMRYRQVKIAARPYMGPALMAELPKVAAVWKDSIRATAIAG